LKAANAHLFRAVHSPADVPLPSWPELAIVGRSNVGKSSLLNRLLGAKGLARVSSTPGRTRAIHYYAVSDRFFYVDLPGYGYARAARSSRQEWAELVDGYFRAGHPAREVLLLVDAEVGATPLDSQAADYLRELGAPFALVATKIDRVSRSQRPAALGRVRRVLGLAEGHSLFPFSARTGEGARELWRHVEEFLAVARAPHETRKKDHHA